MRKSGSSCGAIIELRANGVPAGLGAPIYSKLDTDIAAALISINAVKGVNIGAGMSSAYLSGEENSDEIRSSSGKITFSADDAEALKSKNQKTILVRLETSPEDIHGMHAAKGILTARGGMTSHAAVVARGMGRPCVSGSAEINIDYESKEFKVGDLVIKEGDTITIDGGSGRVMEGIVPTVKPDISGYFSTIMKWSDDFRKLKIRTNSETPKDTKMARNFGAEGIGLCRTEHMFFEEERILSVREMTVSYTHLTLPTICSV